MRPSATSVRGVIDLDRYEKYLLLALQPAGADLPSLLLRGFPGPGVTPFTDTDFFFQWQREHRVTHKKKEINKVQHTHMKMCVCVCVCVPARSIKASVTITRCFHLRAVVKQRTAGGILRSIPLKASDTSGLKPHTLVA